MITIDSTVAMSANESEGTLISRSVSSSESRGRRSCSAACIVRPSYLRAPPASLRSAQLTSNRLAEPGGDEVPHHPHHHPDEDHYATQGVDGEPHRPVVAQPVAVLPDQGRRHQGQERQEQEDMLLRLHEDAVRPGPGPFLDNGFDVLTVLNHVVHPAGEPGGEEEPCAEQRGAPDA